MTGERAIWKFPVFADAFSIELPVGAEVLSVQVQRGKPVLWAIVEPEAPKVTRRFRTVGTGHSLPPDLTLTFVGTFQLHDGDLVIHLFEEARS